jgi:hypothetical protein
MGKAGTGPWCSMRIGLRRCRRSCTVTLLDPLQVRNSSSLSCSSLSHSYPSSPLSLLGLPMDPSSDEFSSLLGPAGPPAHSWCGGLSCSFLCPLLSTGSGGAGKVVMEGLGELSLSHSLGCLSGSDGGMGCWAKSGMVPNHSHEFGMLRAPLMGYPWGALS